MENIERIKEKMNADPDFLCENPKLWGFKDLNQPTLETPSAYIPRSMALPMMSTIADALNGTYFKERVPTIHPTSGRQVIEPVEKYQTKELPKWKIQIARQKLAQKFRDCNQVSIHALCYVVLREICHAHKKVISTRKCADMVAPFADQIIGNLGLSVIDPKEKKPKMVTPKFPKFNFAVMADLDIHHEASFCLSPDSWTTRCELYVHDDHVFVTNLFTVEDQRRKGYAQGLLEEIQRTYTKDIVVHVREDNIPARNLYAKMAFAYESERQDADMPVPLITLCLKYHKE